MFSKGTAFFNVNLKSVIRLLCVDETVFLSPVLSLLGYIGAPLCPKGAQACLAQIYTAVLFINRGEFFDTCGKGKNLFLHNRFVAYVADCHDCKCQSVALCCAPRNRTHRFG